MKPDPETFRSRRNPALRRFAVGIIVIALAMAASGSTIADDSALPDNRATKSGKPLVFHSFNAVALDRDDQAAVAGLVDRSKTLGESSDQSGDQTGLLTQLRFTAEPSLPDSRPRAKGAAASENSAVRTPNPADGAASPSGPAPPIAPNEGASPSTKSVPPGRPLEMNRSGAVSPETDRSESDVPSPNDWPADRGAPPLLSGHGDLPASAWPHGYLREQLAEPLVGASWCNEPFHVDWFLGMIRGTEIIRDHVDQNVGVIGGFRLGWDYDLYWGLETRLGFSSLEDQPESAPLAGGADKVILWDTSLVYYPWGDSRFRPYFGVGLGLAEFQFTDDFGQQIHRNLVELPLGVGLKYRLHDWLTLRADVTDNLALGSSGLATMNNFSFTTGMEYRFGGCHRSYWPWEPSSAH
jgi:opacity protein-like surface antigen